MLLRVHPKGPETRATGRLLLAGIPDSQPGKSDIKRLSFRADTNSCQVDLRRGGDDPGITGPLTDRLREALTMVCGGYGPGRVGSTKFRASGTQGRYGVPASGLG